MLILPGLPFDTSKRGKLAPKLAAKVAPRGVWGVSPHKIETLELKKETTTNERNAKTW